MVKRMALILFVLSWSTTLGGEPEADFTKSMMSAFEFISKSKLHIKPVTVAEQATWSIHALFEAVGEPLPVDVANRLAKLDKANAKEISDLLLAARTHLGRHKKLEMNNDKEACFKAIFARLEPGVPPDQRSSYFRDDQVPRFSLGGGDWIPAGVGLKLENDPDTGMIRVITPTLNSSAYKAGIRAGDIITHIRVQKDGEDSLAAGPAISTKGMSVERANELIFGRPGTRVELTIITGKTQKAKTQ